MRRLTIATVILTLVLGAGGASYVAHIAAQAPSVTTLEADASPQASEVLSAEGQLLARLRDNRYEPVELADVSPHVIAALIATEDHRFHTHQGVDWWRTLQATARTAMGRPEGGSTITQQLARNVYARDIGRGRTIHRKIKEIVTALRIEKRYSKDEILKAYLNSVPFLYNAVGIEAAAQTYFNRPARDLDVLQSATLVGMLKGSAYFNPVQYPDRARQRRNLVLAQMRRFGALAPSAYAALRTQPLALDFRQAQMEPTLAPHFVAYVRKTLAPWAEQHGYDLERDGLSIHTTLRTDLQDQAEAAVAQQAQALQQVADVEWRQANAGQASHSAKYYETQARQGKPFAYFWQTHASLLDESLKKTAAYRGLVGKDGLTATQALEAVRANRGLVDKVRASLTRLEAGLVAIEPATGAIKAWVGSRDHDTDQFDHVAQAMRQPGSTFKPIVYGAALERGISPFRTYMDAPIDVHLDDGSLWRPTDMSGASQLPMTVWEGLVYSKNTITTQVMLDAGLDHISDLARAMGITRSKLDVVPSMALGTSPVTLLEMASVYATIADEGRYHEPYAIDHITDRKGRVLATFGPHAAQQALSRDTADKLVDMLRGVVTQGTGSLMRTRFVPQDRLTDVAGKTGTTQRNTDGWFIAIHPQLVTGAWVGFNDQRVTLRSSYWGQGGHNALLLVGDFMARLVQQKRLDASLAFSSPMMLAVRSMPPGGASEAFDWDKALASPPPAAGVDESGGAIEEVRDAMPRARDDEAPKSAQELGEALKVMGRDPETGVPLMTRDTPGASQGASR